MGGGPESLLIGVCGLPPPRLPTFPESSSAYLRASAEQALPSLLSRLLGLCLHQPLHLGSTASLGPPLILGSQSGMRVGGPPFAADLFPRLQ